MFFIYKTFKGSIEYSFEDNVWHGKLELEKDIVTYESDTFENLHKEFIDAVDDYIETIIELEK